MHILGASRTLPFHSIGGMQAIAWDLFREFAKSGHRVTVLTTAIPGRAEPFESEGVTVVPVKGSKPEAYNRAWWFGSDRAAQALHAQTPVDAVLSISVAAAGMKQFKRAAPRVNFVMQAHGTSWGEFQSKWRSGQPLQWAKSVKNLLWLFKDAAIYRWFDHIVLVGDTLVEQFKRWPMPTVAGATPWTLIRNGVNEEVFRPDPDARVRVRKHLGIPASAPLLAFAARLHPQKGGMELLQAFHELRKHCPGCELMIIGDGEDAARLRRFAASQDWHAQVHFTGSLDRAQVPDYLAAADAFAFPTLRKEGLPMNVLEALSCGLPAVCSEQTRDVFAADLPLYFAQPTAPLGFASACLRAFQEPHVARNLLTSSYLLSACADAYLAVLGEATC